MVQIGGTSRFGRGRRLLNTFYGVVDNFAESESERSRTGGPGAVWRRCPYCTNWIDLRACNIVSAIRHGARRGGRSSFDDVGPAASPGGDDDYEVLFNPSLAARSNRPNSVLGDLLSSEPKAPGLMPLTAAAPPHMMPRRCCGLCRRLLPEELDWLSTKILAVVGITGAGKTHYLAQSLNEGMKGDSLSRFGCTEFAATDADKTAHALRNDYYAPLFRRRELFEPTDPNEAPRQFTMTATVAGAPFLLVTHDIAGESVTDPYQRAQTLTFLRRADAMIFLLDPTDFEAVRPQLPPHLIGVDKPADQVHLLRQCLKEIDQTSESEIPVRIVLAKSDLITAYCGISGPWLRPAAPDWRTDIRPISDSVQQMLAQFRETEVLRVVERRQRVLFHAISVLGAPPGADGSLAEHKPIRCADPLGMALLGMTGQSPANP